MAVTGKQYFPPSLLQITQKLQGGIRLRPQTAIHPACIDFKRPSRFQKGIHCGKRRHSVAFIHGVKVTAALVEFRHKVKMSDKGRICSGDHLRLYLKEPLRQRIYITAEALANALLQHLRAFVHAVIHPVLLHIMHRANHIIKSLCRRSRTGILLHATENFNFILILFRKGAHLRLIFRHILRTHAPDLLILRTEIIEPVPRKAKARKALRNRRLHHLLRRFLPVAVGGVGMKIHVRKSHFVIFSCFTLWSMMCLFANSLRISSREMPCSVISTIT